jgi:hypothetical protein
MYSDDILCTVRYLGNNIRFGAVEANPRLTILELLFLSHETGTNKRLHQPSTIDTLGQGLQSGVAFRVPTLPLIRGSSARKR